MSKRIMSRRIETSSGGRFILSALAVVVMFGALNASCIGHLLRRTETIDLVPICDSLPVYFPEYLADSPALFVIVDTSPCGKALGETVRWKEWQRAATAAGINFVFVTSKSDSADVAVAAKLDSVTAPVLVMPSCKHRFTELGIPQGILPLKILMDQGGEFVDLWLPILREERNAQLMDKLAELGRQSE